MITVEHDREHYIVCRVSDRLAKEDYDAAVPELENAIGLRHGKVRLLVLLEDFRGWSVDAMWEDLKFDFRHRQDFDRIAVVGDTRVEEWVTRLSQPIFRGEVRFYDQDDRAMAEAWLSEPAHAPREPEMQNS